MLIKSRTIAIFFLFIFLAMFIHYKFSFPHSKKSELTLVLKSEVFKNFDFHLENSEILQNAFVFQAVSGTLVRFSNHGRHVPYLASNWIQKDNAWIFNLHRELKCASGELIDGNSFRKSLLISLKEFGKTELSNTPFRYLTEITADGFRLIFNFSRPVGKSLLEYLGTPTFSYRCAPKSHESKRYAWEQLVSSGPYLITDVDSAKNVVKLELRKDWPLKSNSAPAIVYLTNDDSKVESFDAKIEMSYSITESNPKSLTRILEVPRALLSVRLNHTGDNFFSQIDNRKILQVAIKNQLNNIRIPLSNYHRAESFTFGQSTEVLRNAHAYKVNKPKLPLVIRGALQSENEDALFYQKAVFGALEDLKWRYRPAANSTQTAAEFHKLNFDLAFDRSFVDTTLDPDFIRMLFKSKIGPKFPDPNLRISKLLEMFDLGKMTYKSFVLEFNQRLDQEAAVIPLFHRGFTYQLSRNINEDEISPLMAILNYDELKINN